MIEILIWCHCEKVRDLKMGKYEQLTSHSKEWVKCLGDRIVKTWQNKKFDWWRTWVKITKSTNTNLKNIAEFDFIIDGFKRSKLKSGRNSD